MLNRDELKSVSLGECILSSKAARSIDTAALVTAILIHQFGRGTKIGTTYLVDEFEVCRGVKTLHRPWFQGEEFSVITVYGSQVSTAIILTSEFSGLEASTFDAALEIQFGAASLLAAISQEEKQLGFEALGEGRSSTDEKPFEVGQGEYTVRLRSFPTGRRQQKQYVTISLRETPQQSSNGFDDLFTLIELALARLCHRKPDLIYAS